MIQRTYSISIDPNEHRIHISSGDVGMEMTPMELIRIAVEYDKNDWRRIIQECEWALL